MFGAGVSVTNKENLEKIIEISQNVEERHPRFVGLTKFLVGKKRVGIEFYTGEKKTEEYTVCMYGYSIEKYEEGIHDPVMVQRWQEKVLEEYVKQEVYIINHPILARLCYFPREIWKGNMSIARIKLGSFMQD